MLSSWMPWSHVSLDQNQVQRFFNHLNVVIVDSVVDITIGVDDFRESRSSDQDQGPDEDNERSVQWNGFPRRVGEFNNKTGWWYVGQQNDLNLFFPPRGL